MREIEDQTLIEKESHRFNLKYIALKFEGKKFNLDDLYNPESFPFVCGNFEEFLDLLDKEGRFSIQKYGEIEDGLILDVYYNLYSKIPGESDHHIIKLTPNEFYERGRPMCLTCETTKKYTSKERQNELIKNS